MTRTKFPIRHETIESGWHHGETSWHHAITFEFHLCKFFFDMLACFCLDVYFIYRAQEESDDESEMMSEI